MGFGFVTVVPKYLNCATFSKDVLVTFIFWFCPAFWWRDMPKYLVFSAFKLFLDQPPYFRILLPENYFVRYLNIESHFNSTHISLSHTHTNARARVCMCYISDWIRISWQTALWIYSVKAAIFDRTGGSHDRKGCPEWRHAIGLPWLWSLLLASVHTTPTSSADAHHCRELPTVDYNSRSGL